MYNTSLHYGSYVFPRWGKALGVCMGATCCLQILIWAVVAISKESGTLREVSITVVFNCVMFTPLTTATLPVQPRLIVAYHSAARV